MPSTEWETQGRIDRFPLGAHDIPDRLPDSRKVVRPATEKSKRLLAAFDRVVSQRQAGVGVGIRLFRNRQILGRQ